MTDREVQKLRKVRSATCLTLLGSLALTAALTAAGCSKAKTSTPTSPTSPPVTTDQPFVMSVVVTGGTVAFTQVGAAAQFAATVTLSTGATENRTTSATWQSSNTSVATVSAQGVVTAQAVGDARISAVVSTVLGSREVTVRVAPVTPPPPATGRRTPDPPPGQRLPQPNVQALVQQLAAQRPDLMAQSCPNGLKYVNNPWLDYIVDRLRTEDTRWGYNAKPVKTAVDNNGVAVVAAGDEIAYHFSAGADEGSTDVYLIDILEGHCGPNPRVTYRVFTGEEPGRWTGARRF